MQIFIKISLISLLLSSLAITNVALAKEEKYLCISEVSSGLIYRNGTWVATEFKAGIKYLIDMKNGLPKSVKEFGAPKEQSMNNCYLMSPKSYVCEDNFDRFRFQPSTMRFIMTKTAGYTNEYEEAGIKFLPTSFTPNISIGVCEIL